MDYLSFYSKYIPDLKHRSGDQYIGKCPFVYKHTNGEDRNPSLEINISTGQYFCHACHEEGNKITFCKKIGIEDKEKKSKHELRKIEAVYKYYNSERKLLYEIIRYEGKDFKMRRPNPNPNGQRWLWKMKGVARYPYRLPELIEAEINAPVFIPEGEKKVDKLLSLGFVATCNPCGAGKWSNMVTDVNKYFTGREIIIMPDADKVGENHAEQVAYDLYPEAKKIKILRLPGLREKEDVIDWIDAEKLKRVDIEDIKKNLLDLAGQATIWTLADQANFKKKDDTIKLEGGQMPWIVDKAEAILLRQSPCKIFQRGGQLIKISILDKNKEISGIRHSSGAAIITPINDPHYITDIFGRHMKFIKDDAIVDPPQKVGKTYLARTGEWNVPNLNRIIECPTMKIDGTILDQPGYDWETGLYFHAGYTKYEKIARHPGIEDARWSLILLKDLFSEFPFQCDEDQSVAIAAVLTAIIRSSLRSAPLFGFTAPTMASGKSLLAEIIGLIATGRLPAIMSQSQDYDEDRKKILALLLSGDPLIVIDNCEKPISGGALCTILTQEYYQDRILSKNVMAKVNTGVMIMATGNNLQFLGDMTTRALLCTIDAKMERPEERVFKRNLYDYIKNNRSKYCNAALTILKAYFDAGKPISRELKPYGRFEAWSDLIRGALVWLGEKDPCNTRFKIDINDNVHEQLKKFLNCWHDSYKTQPMTIQNVLKDCADGIEKKDEDSQNLGEILQIIAGEKGNINPRKLSWYIKKYEGRIISGLRIIRDEKSGTRSRWKIDK